MQKLHNHDPMSLPPLEGDSFLPLLAWCMDLTEDEERQLRTAALDKTHGHGLYPRGLNGQSLYTGDPEREAILQMVHPRSAALIDLRLRSSPTGKLTRIENMIPYSGVNRPGTSQLLNIAFSSIWHAITLPAEDRAMRRKTWRQTAEARQWPYTDVPGARNTYQRNSYFRQKTHNRREI